MTDKMQPPRTTSRSSPTTGLLVLIGCAGIGRQLTLFPANHPRLSVDCVCGHPVPLDAYNNRVNTSGPGNTAHTSSSGGPGRSDLPGSL